MATEDRTALPKMTLYLLANRNATDEELSKLFNIKSIKLYKTAALKIIDAKTLGEKIDAHLSYYENPSKKSMLIASRLAIQVYLAQRVK